MTTCACGCGQPVPMTDTYPCGRKRTRPPLYIHGHNSKLTAIKHGRSHTPEYEIYVSARQRCTNPKSVAWPFYGGRGIKFLFVSFEQFFAELGPRPEGMSLDRRDNDGNYEPGNVRWATKSEQEQNKFRKKAA